MNVVWRPRPFAYLAAAFFFEKKKKKNVTFAFLLLQILVHRYFMAGWSRMYVPTTVCHLSLFAPSLIVHSYVVPSTNERRIRTYLATTPNRMDGRSGTKRIMRPMMTGSIFSPKYEQTNFPPPCFLPLSKQKWPDSVTQFVFFSCVFFFFWSWATQIVENIQAPARAAEKKWLVIFFFAIFSIWNPIFASC